MVTKSRSLTKQEFFSIIQLEWISNKVRENIYERDCDKKRFNDICEMKKEKIDKYADRECVKSIFTSKEIKLKYIHRFLMDGTVNFEYKDIFDKEKTGKWDKFYLAKSDICEQSLIKMF